MSTKLENMISTLFTAPCRATVQTERDCRQIWVEWLEDLNNMIIKLTNIDAGTDVTNVIAKHLDLAPIMKMNAKIEIGLTMRLASIKENSGKMEVGLSVGPIGASGSYGFMSRSTAESVMQVHAAYTMSNNDVSLKDYLASSNLSLSSAGDVTTAIDTLKQ